MAIRHKLVAVIMLTSMVALALAGGVFIGYQYISTRRAMVKTLQTQAEMIADNCKAAVQFEVVKDAEDVLRAFRAQPSVMYAVICNRQGNLFARYVRPGVEGTDRFVEGVLEGKDGYRFGDGYLLVGTSIVLEGEKVGCVAVWSDLEPVRTMFQRNLLMVCSVLLLSFMAAYLVSHRVQGVISSPILGLAEVAKTVSERKEYSTRAAKQGNDEVGFLIDSFNEMLGQIQERDAALVGANERLEARVRDRTAELSQTNEQLKAEIIHRQKAEQTLRERSERIIRHQAVLLKLNKMTETDETSTFSVTTEEVAKTLDVARVGIWLLDGQGHRLSCQDLYTLQDHCHEKGGELQAGGYPRYMQALEASRIVAADDITKDPRTVEFGDSYAKALGVTSRMDVPIRSHGKLVGVICHEHVGAPRQWTLEEQDFVASVADMIVFKLEGAARRKAQQALRDSERRYRTLLKNIPQRIFYKDLNGTYMLCNESYAQVLRLDSPDEITGKTDHDFHPKELADKYRADDQRIMTNGVAEELEEPYIQDGQQLTVQTLKSPVRNEQGQTIGIFGIFWDITARKQAEKALEEINRDLQSTVQELQRSNRELQDFAYVTAHDLKAPLRAIGTLSDWLFGDYQDRLDEQGRDHLQLIKGRVSRMNELIDSILRYSEIGRGNRNMQRVNLNTVVSETLASLNPPERFQITLADELPTVVGEKIRLAQVFQHLIGNALRYNDKPEGRIEIGSADDGERWTFSVSDNGPGIPEKYHEKIFKMFQTLAPRDELESIGIGLAVVKKIVELYGGRVWVESTVGQGSTFFFTLPKAIQSEGGRLHSASA
jgi:PAS domain S-box-containing protein